MPNKMPEDNISVALVRKLNKCFGGGGGSDEDGPRHFFLDFAQCNSLEAMEYVGEVLQTNKTISWLEVEFRYQQISVDCMANLFQFVSHHPTLKVLEVRMGASSHSSRTPVSTMGFMDEVMRLFLLAAAQNGNIETVYLKGKPCQHVTEIFKFIGSTCSNIQELELVDFPDSVVGAWPPNSSIRKLTLKPMKSERYRNPFNPDGHPGLTGILDLLADSSSRGYSIKHLHIEQWSWSLSKYLQSCNSSVESLHLGKVDFRHERLTGFSNVQVFIFGLQGSKTTTELCLEACVLDKKAADKLLLELKNDTLGIKTLRLKNMDLDGKQIQQLFECEGLERLEFVDGPLDIIDKCVDCVNDGLGSCALSSLSALKFPLTNLSSLGPSLKIAATTHSLSRLEITNTYLKRDDVECITNLLADERCQLRHLGIQYLIGFDPKIILAMEGEKCSVESLRLEDVIGESLSTIVDTLVGSLAQIKTMNSLTIVCPDLLPKMERELTEALPGNWSLINLVFERLEAPEGSAERIHKVEPVISRTFANKVDQVLERNRAKRRSTLTTSSPNSVMTSPEIHDSVSLTELPLH